MCRDEAYEEVRAIDREMAELIRQMAALRAERAKAEARKNEAVKKIVELKAALGE